MSQVIPKDQDNKQTSKSNDPEGAVKETQTPVANQDLQDQLEALQAELEQQKHLNLLARADFENYRKHMETEKAKFGLMSNMQLVMQILEVIDDTQLALQDDQIDKNRAVEMLGIVNDKLNVALTVAGLEKVEIKTGDKFDSQTMEAITTTPVDSEDKDQTVVSIVNAAYRYKGQAEMLKTAKVIVGKFKS